ncbi:MAG: hypothetical protein KJS92_10835, partial [Bacteroidetes bacterium]|nr:hypothetical protein [Bacteroidota bacterium]
KAGVMNPDPRLAKIWAKHLFELLPEGSEAPYLKELLRNEQMSRSTRIGEVVNFIGMLDEKSAPELCGYLETWLMEPAQKPWHRIAAEKIQETIDELSNTPIDEDVDRPVNNRPLTISRLTELKAKLL